MRSEATARGDPGTGDWKQLSKLRLEKHLERHVDDPELKGFLPVIQGLTRLLPSDRVSASQPFSCLGRTYGCLSRAMFDVHLQDEGEQRGNEQAL